MPTGWLLAWIFNFFVWVIETISWAVGGDFFVMWSHVGLWGGLFLCWLPWIFEIVYIGYEFPTVYSMSWAFKFYSSEFFLLFMQLIVWLFSLIIHATYVDAHEYHLVARKYLTRQPKRCSCDTCVLPNDELERARAELACTIACQKKCPPEVPQCPLKQF
jgi:hypothetical protein